MYTPISVTIQFDPADLAALEAAENCEPADATAALDRLAPLLRTLRLAAEDVIGEKADERFTTP